VTAIVCTLADVAAVESGAGFPVEMQGQIEGEFPFLKVSDMNLPGNERDIVSWNNTVAEGVRRDLRAKAFPAGSTIFPKIGAAIATNKKRVLTRPSCLDNNVMAVIPNPERLDSGFLYFMLLAKNLSDFASASNPPSIRKTDVEAWSVRVPLLAEQRRIVDLLSRAEGIVRLRREAQRKAAEIVPAIFLDMFGDPATNPKGWPMRRVDDFVARFEGGKNLQAGDEGQTPHRILKVSAVTSGKYLEAESKPTPNDYVPSASHFVRKGDLLFSRANTSELVGATALVESTNGKTLLPDKLWRFVWREETEPRYVHALFQNSGIRRHLGRLSSGTSASMRNISQAKLFELRLPVAPHAMQMSFREHSLLALSIVQRQSSAAAHAQAAFDALLARFFQPSSQVSK
jgi:type I restriction enzyme S subunit